MSQYPYDNSGISRAKCLISTVMLSEFKNIVPIPDASLCERVNKFYFIVFLNEKYGKYENLNGKYEKCHLKNRIF